MATIIGVVLGMVLGFLFIKKSGEKRMYQILVKMGISDTQLQQFMHYYKNYNAIQKQAKKAYFDNAMKMEVAYNLQKNVAVPFESQVNNVPNVEKLSQEEKPENVPQL